MNSRILLTLMIFIGRLYAQQDTSSQAVMQQILQRLDALERQNQALLDEIHSLKQQLHAASEAENKAEPRIAQPAQATVEERVTVAERRIEEQAQTKVEASQKFPISLSGMLLFNAFGNSASPIPESGGDYTLLNGPERSGSTVRQTLLGLDFQGPSLPGGGRVNGSLMMDFWGGSSTPAAGWLRLRTADLTFNWPNRSFSVGQDRPLISPYQPDSLAEVGVPPLAGSGNLWYWLPQARYEERLHVNPNNGFTAQIALMQTRENDENVPDEYSSSLEPARPALEGRFAFWHKFDDVRRIEIAPGFHTSSTHVAGTTVGSRIASFDWRVVPASKIQITGTAYVGRNVAGLGALGNGFIILPDDTVRAVHSSGGWTQVSLALSSRLTLNIFSGLEDDRGTDLVSYGIARNLTYASNVVYHLGPNVVVAVEGLQMRARLFSVAPEVHNHYDVALGYLF